MPKHSPLGSNKPNASSRSADPITPDISLEGPKQFAALARVSSREQEREGFSLEVQEEALGRYAEQEGGTIIHLVRIAETASKKHERKAFKELIAYTKKNAHRLDGLLFFKVDRAARNLFDYVDLERLELDYGVPVIYVSQTTENTPAGRMMRRTLANMAAFYTEQQSIDVREGHERRVQNGLFVSKAPYGYRNIRQEGRGLVEVDPVTGPKVSLLFQLYAYQGHTLDSLIDELVRRGVTYTDTVARFTRSKVHEMLRSRAYLGEVFYRGQWHDGAHTPLVDLETFQRVQKLLGGRVQKSHEMTYAGELITCGFCGHPITGECKTKQTKLGPKNYIYYRCARYNRKGHPRIRVREQDIEDRVFAMFDRIRIEDDQQRDWFRRALQASTRHGQQDQEKQIAELSRRLSVLRNQQDRLLNLRLLDEIEDKTYGRKNVELRDQIAETKLLLDKQERSKAEQGEVALKVFELSQTLRTQWLSADYRAKRRLLQIVCLNFILDDVTLVCEMNKPFDVLAEGLDSSEHRGGRT